MLAWLWQAASGRGTAADGSCIQRSARLASGVPRTYAPGMSREVEGVVLAAGRSRRMEQPKPTLAIGAVTFVERAVKLLRDAGCARVIVVAGADAAWADALEAAGDVAVVRNANAGSEQIDSLRLALDHLLPSTKAVLVLPVDVPLVSVDTAAAVLRTYGESRSRLVLPFHNGVAGHPVLVGQQLFHRVREGMWEEGMRSLILAHADELTEVRVNDPGTLIDIDTPEEYRQFVEQQ